MLREAEQLYHRGKAKAPTKRHKPTAYCATQPNAVWSGGITWLSSVIRGQFFYLYMVMDIYSRKIVGWEAHDNECAEHAATLIEKACWAEQVRGESLVLHSNNGSPMMYNHEHHHSALKFVTPAQRHAGKDHRLLAKRHALYDKAQADTPRTLERGYTQLATRRSRAAQSR